MNNDQDDIEALEKVLIECYVIRSLSSDSKEQAELRLAKARALNAPYLFYMLGKYYKKIKNYDSALLAFEKAYDIGLREPLFLFELGDFFLRHGTYEQYTGLYKKQLCNDNNDHYAKFILDTLDFYHATVTTLHSQINRNYGTSKPKIIFNTTFWGLKYADIFIKYSLAALMSEKNIPHLAQKYEIHFVIATTPSDFSQLQSNPLFNRLLCHVYIHLVELPAKLLEYALAYAKEVGGNWSIPVTMLTNAHQYAVIECARLLGLDLLLLYPDHILSNTFLFDLLPEVNNFSAISGVCFRLYYDTPLLNFIDAHRNSAGILDVNSQMLIKWLLEYLPEENYVDSKIFSTYPIYLCWKVGDEGIIAHVNHYCLWFIRGSDLKGPVYPSLDPIDGFFLDRHLIDKQNIGLASEKVIGFDLSNNPSVHPLDGTSFSPAKVATWFRPFITEVHKKYFNHAMKYSLIGKSDSMEWDNAINSAKSTVQEIITMAECQ